MRLATLLVTPLVGLGTAATIDTAKHYHLPRGFSAPTAETLDVADFLAFSSTLDATELKPLFADLKDEAAVTDAIHKKPATNATAVAVQIKDAEGCDFKCQCSLICQLWIWMPPMWIYCMAKCGSS